MTRGDRKLPSVEEPVQWPGTYDSPISKKHTHNYFVSITHINNSVPSSNVCVCGEDFLRPPSDSPTPAECPTIWFNSDAFYLEVEPDPT